MFRVCTALAATCLLSGCVISANEGYTDYDRIVSVDRADLIVRVSGQSGDVQPGERATAMARCPVGYVALGGGHGFTTSEAVPDDDVDFYLWRSLPWRVPGSRGTYDTWRADGVLDADVSSWRLVVTATCSRWQPDESDVDARDIPLPELAIKR
ncbi:MAG: hypothetical protein AAF545_04050 [Pseudomonadota bacterium]